MRETLLLLCYIAPIMCATCFIVYKLTRYLCKNEYIEKKESWVVETFNEHINSLHTWRINALEARLNLLLGEPLTAVTIIDMSACSHNINRLRQLERLAQEPNIRGQVLGTFSNPTNPTRQNSTRQIDEQRQSHYNQRLNEMMREEMRAGRSSASFERTEREAARQAQQAQEYEIQRRIFDGTSPSVVVPIPIGSEFIPTKTQEKELDDEQAEQAEPEQEEFNSDNAIDDLELS